MLGMNGVVVVHLRDGRRIQFYRKGDGYPKCVGIVLKSLVDSIMYESSGMKDIDDRILAVISLDKGFSMEPYVTVHDDVGYVYHVDMEKGTVTFFDTGGYGSNVPESFVSGLLGSHVRQCMKDGNGDRSVTSEYSIH